jgi:hypothetical protein
MNSCGERGTSGASAARGAGVSRKERRSEYRVWCGWGRVIVWRGLVSHNSRLGGTDPTDGRDEGG